MNKAVKYFFPLLIFIFFMTASSFGLIVIIKSLFSEKILKDNEGIPYKLYCNDNDSKYLSRFPDLSRVNTLIESCSEELSKDIDIEKFHVRSQGYLYLKEYDKSLSDIQRALEINAKEERLHVHKVEIFRKQQKYEEMIDEYKNMIKLFPKSANLYRSLITDIEMDIFDRNELRLNEEGVINCLSAPNYFNKISKDKSNMLMTEFVRVQNSDKSIKLVFEDMMRAEGKNFPYISNISNALVILITSADKIKDSHFDKFSSKFIIEKNNCNYSVEKYINQLYLEKID